MIFIKTFDHVSSSMLKYEMKVIITGAPGTGKGTYAKMLSNTFGIPHISLGDLIRKEILSNSELGQKYKHFVSVGQLIPDAYVLDLLKFVYLYF